MSRLAEQTTSHAKRRATWCNRTMIAASDTLPGDLVTLKAMLLAQSHGFIVCELWISTLLLSG
jgi:hypothetical protein